MDATALRRAWDADGFVVLPELLSAAECDRFRAAAARVRAEKADPQRTVYVGLAAADAAFHDLAAHPTLVEALRAVMDDGIAFWSDKLVFKSRAKSFPTPWHIDASYWPDTRPKLSVWLALDDVGPDDGALKVVRGSHRLALPTLDADASTTNQEFQLVVPTDAWSAADELACPLRRGGAVVFGDRVVHGSLPSTSGRDRWAWIGTYRDALGDEACDGFAVARRTLVPAPTAARR